MKKLLLYPLYLLIALPLYWLIGHMQVFGGGRAQR
jgi:hypothetical protein